MNRPVILAGHGVHGAELEFYQFITRVRAPVLLTWKAIGLLPDNHPLYCGRPGMVGQYAANRILQAADFLLVLGAKMDKDQVAYQLERIAPLAMKIVVDIDQAELDKFDNSWAKIRMDVRKFMPDYIMPRGSMTWINQCRMLNKMHPVVDPAWWNEDAVNYYCFLDELTRLADANDVISPECSNAAPPLFQTWRVKLGQQFTYAGALGAMGSGIPGAIGAALATGKRVLSVIGDGGFMLNIQELEVVRRLNLPIKFFVMDNGGYGAIMNTQRAYFNGRYVGSNRESGLTLPDINTVAESFGLATDYIPYNSSIHNSLEWIMHDNTPMVTVIDIPDTFHPVHVVSKTMVNGQPTTGKFEDV